MLLALWAAASYHIVQVMFIDNLRLYRWRAGGSAQVYLQPQPQQVRKPPSFRVMQKGLSSTLSALKCLLKGREWRLHRSWYLNASSLMTTDVCVYFNVFFDSDSLLGSFFFRAVWPSVAPPLIFGLSPSLSLQVEFNGVGFRQSVRTAAGISL